MPCALPPPVSASMSITMTISRYCPLWAMSHGTSFSIPIPAPFLTFLVTLWSPESRRCILDIPPGAHSLSEEPRPGPGGGRQPPASTGTPKDRSPASQWNTCPAASLPCFLRAKDRSRPKARTPGSLRTWCQQSFLESRTETHTPPCAIRPFPAKSRSEGRARGCQVGWRQTQQVAPPLFPGFSRPPRGGLAG